ncbi:unnamed protein product [Euphydryas editha]|uniref:Uncharacterized protein n=1 Tax=Euphydryas editha TaxID=104508 RepID=A0AAU9TTT2_EUPED|nr:unnamed protein product [Euphydryas editha]
MDVVDCGLIPPTGNRRNVPIKVEWSAMGDHSINRKVVKKEDLGQSIHYELTKHYESLPSPNVETVVLTHLLQNGKKETAIDSNTLQESTGGEFRHK